MLQRRVAPFPRPDTSQACSVAAPFWGSESPGCTGRVWTEKRAGPNQKVRRAHAPRACCLPAPRSWPCPQSSVEKCPRAAQSLGGWM